MQYTIKTATDPQVYLGQKQQRVVHWMKNAAFFCMIASMILSVYAFRTDIVEAYTAFKTSLQVEDSCGYPMEGDVFFTGDISGCQTIVPPGFNTICYHGPTDFNSLYTS